MSNVTVEKFHKVEKEIKKLISELISVKDENETLKKRIDQLELFKSSVSKDVEIKQKIILEYTSLKNSHNILCKEKEQLRERIEQILNRLETFQLY